MRKILILEDKIAEQQEIIDVIGMIERPTKVLPCVDTKEAYACALEGDIDLFIIDVILKPEDQEDTSGLKFVESIRGVTRYEFTPVIILTCLEDLRSYSYENLHCYAFIEKPFSRERLKKTIEECLRSPRMPERARTLYYRKEGAILAVQREDIMYATSIRHSIHIHTSKKDTIAIPYLTVKKFLADVNSRDFMQCSRSTVVNKKYISSVDLTRRKIWLGDGDKSVEIGVTYVATIREMFGSQKDEQ